jgi:hypothetical protein
VPRCRAFAKGDLEGPQNEDDNDNNWDEPRTAEATFVPGHALLNARIAHLHARLPHDEHAQVYMLRVSRSLYMDPFAPPQPPGPEPAQSTPLTRADLQSIRLELKSCTCVVEACQRQVHDVGRKLDKLTELFNFTANVLCWFTLIYYGGSWIFSHVKIGWA